MSVHSLASQDAVPNVGSLPWFLAFTHRRSLEAAQEQYQTLQPARAKPHILDNYTVGRVTEVFTAQKNDLWLFDEQLKRWAAQPLTTRQRTEVQRLTGQMATLRQVIADILALADELKRGTIEQVLGVT